MSMLIAHAVDEAFARLSKLYGREFASKFEGDDIDAVKAAWARELAPLPRALDSIAWALRNLPERCPNAIQFRNLCKQAPRPQQLAMAASTDPVRGPTVVELDALKVLRDGIVFKRPGKQWASDLVERYERGDRRMSTGALRMALEVVGAAAARPTGAPLPTDVPPNPYASFLAESEEEFYP